MAPNPDVSPAMDTGGPGARRLKRANKALALGALALLVASGAAFAQDDAAGLALALVNEARSAAGLPGLSSNSILRAAAQAHAEDMARRDFYSHVTPEGLTARARYLAAGGSPRHPVAENIATCTRCDVFGVTALVRRLQNGWMKSPGHRGNILARELAAFGYGLASRGDRFYAVQMFAGPGAPQASPDARPASTEEIRRAAREAMNAARREAGLPAFQAAPGLDRLARRIAARTSFAGEELVLPREPFALLPDVRAGWTRLASAARGCGGCGTVLTSPDAANFAGLLAQAQGADYTHAGFALIADGEGWKIAVAVFGRR